MKKLFFLLPAFVLFCSLVSCTEEDLDDFIKNTGNSNLSDSEIIDGLKTALTTGTDSSTSVLSKANGYFKDEAVKILLPQEIQNKIESLKSKNRTISEFGLTFTISGEDLYNNGFGIENPFGSGFLWKVNGVKGKEDSLILGLNRAAEAAAKSAGPVFKNAITTMTISDGLAILNGEDTAATSYLRTKTFNPLFYKYEPTIDSALKNVTVGGKSVVELYEDYVGSYNTILTKELGGTSISSAFNVSTIGATDISEYGTNKALDGLFIKVRNEEQKIRLNPFAYVSEILRKVFGNRDTD